MKILVTGGTGYIGSHTCVELLNQGHDVIIIDNLSNSKIEVIDAIQSITNKKVLFYQVDLLDIVGLEKIFQDHNFDAVIHFAGLKSVAESVRDPLIYYQNNVVGAINLIEMMKKYNVKNIVFSSSATVYGYPKENPIKETHPKNPINPYGRTKSMIEDILEDLYKSDNEWSITVLRYFNPVGAHESGEIGEDPNGEPNNLMPIVTSVAIGKIKSMKVFGNTYNTHDGTCIRDYIHVVDLAKGHICAIKNMKKCGFLVYNLGTGNPYSVLELINCFTKINGVVIDYEFSAKREGDADCCFADSSNSHLDLNWSSKFDIFDMCKSSFFWSKNKRKNRE